MKKEEIKERLSVLYERSKDHHNVYTPLELCEEMIGKPPELGGKKILVMFNLEFLLVLRDKLGKEGMKNVWFLTPCDLKKRAAINIGVVENQIYSYVYNTKVEIMSKFDVVIGNPPYKGSFYIDFLNISLDISNHYVLMVHPGTIYFNEKENKKLNKEILFKNNVEKYLKEIDLFNSRKYFDVALWVPMAISFIDKSKTNDEIIVNDKINNEEYFYSKLSDVNKYGTHEEYFSLKEKILSFKDNLQNYVKDSYIIKAKENSKYFVNLSQLRGHIYTDVSKLADDDFYTFVPKSEIVETTVTKHLFFEFEKETEAYNFLKYLKTNFARFCLSIFKINMNVNRGELKAVPWLDFKQEWDDRKIYDYFNLSKNEIEFIEKHIPNYYEN